MYSEQFMRLWGNYREARKEKERLKKESDDAYEAFKKAEAVLVDAMLDADSDRFDADGMTIYRSANRECSVTSGSNGKPGNIEQVAAWLDKERGGKETFMRLQIDPWAVKRLVREELKDGVDPESYPAFLKVAVRPRLNVKGWIGSEEGGDEE